MTRILREKFLLAQLRRMLLNVQLYLDNNSNWLDLSRYCPPAHHNMHQYHTIPQYSSKHQMWIKARKKGHVYFILYFKRSAVIRQHFQLNSNSTCRFQHKQGRDRHRHRQSTLDVRLQFQFVHFQQHDATPSFQAEKAAFTRTEHSTAAQSWGYRVLSVD